jgi:hypothetical protein
MDNIDSTYFVFSVKLDILFENTKTPPAGNKWS